MEGAGALAGFAAAGLAGICDPGFCVRGNGSSAFRFVPVWSPFFRSSVAGRTAGVGFRASGLELDEETVGEGAVDGVGIGVGLPVSIDERTESRKLMVSIIPDEFGTKERRQVFM